MDSIFATLSADKNLYVLVMEPTENEQKYLTSMNYKKLGQNLFYTEDDRRSKIMSGLLEKVLGHNRFVLMEPCRHNFHGQSLPVIPPASNQENKVTSPIEFVWSIYAKPSLSERVAHTVCYFSDREKAYELVKRIPQSGWRCTWYYSVQPVEKSSLSGYALEDLDTIPNNFPY